MLKHSSTMHCQHSTHTTVQQQTENSSKANITAKPHKTTKLKHRQQQNNTQTSIALQTTELHHTDNSITT